MPCCVSKTSPEHVSVTLSRPCRVAHTQVESSHHERRVRQNRVKPTIADISQPAAIVRVDGRLRAPVTEHVKRRVAALLTQGERRILLDVGSLSDVDAAGIGELAGAFTMANAACSSLRISGANKRLRRLLNAVGLLTLLEGDGDAGDHGGRPGPPLRRDAA